MDWRDHALLVPTTSAKILLNLSSNPATMFHSSAHLLRLATRRYSSAVPPVAAAPRKIGALRGGFTGFFVGVSVTGAASYYYLLDLFEKTNRAVLVDLMSLTESVHNLEQHVKSIEERK